MKHSLHAVKLLWESPLCLFSFLFYRVMRMGLTTFALGIM